MRGALFFIIFLISSFIVPAEEEPMSKAEKDDLKEETLSLREEREEQILYGVDSEIIELVSKLQEEKNKDHLSSLEKAAENSKNSLLKDAVLKYFIDMGYFGCIDFVLSLFENRDMEKGSLVKTAVRFIAESGDKDKFSAVADALADGTADDFKIDIIRGIAILKDPSYARLLMDIYNNEDETLPVKQEIILAFGKIGAKEAEQILIDVMDDGDSDKLSRQYACSALGSIKSEKACRDIIRFYDDPDPQMRNCAVNAAAQYRNEETDRLLSEALKDENWRVRISAAKAIGENRDKKAVPIMIYKAKNDPVKNVRVEAARALGNIGTPECFSVLEQLAENMRTAQDVRVESVKILAEKHRGESLAVLNRIMDKEWTVPNSKVMDCLCKTLAAAEDSSLAPEFEKMLSHPDISVKIYGIKGIGKNKIRSLKEKIGPLADKKQPLSIRKNALNALEQLK